MTRLLSPPPLCSHILSHPLRHLLPALTSHLSPLTSSSYLSPLASFSLLSHPLTSSHLLLPALSDLRLRGRVSLYHQIKSGSIKSWWEYDAQVEPLEEINTKLKVGAMLRQAFDGQPFPLEIFSGTPDGIIKHAHPPTRRFWSLVLLMRMITHSPWFSRAMVGLILLSASEVGTQSAEDITETSVIQWTCKVVFFLELGMRLVAEGFNPLYYFFDKKRFFPGEAEPVGFRRLGAVRWWHVFDAIVVLGSVMSVMVNSVYLKRLVVLRLLLVVKKLKRWPKLQLALVTLTEGIEVIAYALLLLAMLIYLFALLGYSLFRKNDPWHFGSLHMAMFSILRITTLDNWTDILYTNVYGCDMWLGDDMMQSQCTHPAALGWIASTYFILVVVFGNLILLNSFTGIVIISMGKVLRDMNEAAEMAEQLTFLRRKFNINSRQLKSIMKAFHLINIEQTDFLSVDALMIAMKGADIDISHQAINDVVYYALRQKQAEVQEEFASTDPNNASQRGGDKRANLTNMHRKSLYMSSFKAVTKVAKKKGAMHMLGLQRVRDEDVKRALAEEKAHIERRMKEHLDQGKGFDLRMFVEVMIKAMLKPEDLGGLTGLSMMERYMGIPTWQEIAAGNLLVRNVKGMQGRATLLSAKRTEWKGKLAQKEVEILKEQLRALGHEPKCLLRHDFGVGGLTSGRLSKVLRGFSVGGGTFGARSNNDLTAMANAEDDSADDYNSIMDASRGVVAKGTAFRDCSNHVITARVGNAIPSRGVGLQYV
jgi:voltage-gated sodium channel